MEFDHIVKDLENLPSLPNVVNKMIEVMEDDNSNADDLVKVISKDQSLVARLLKLVNSSFYGFPEKIISLSRAVVILGHRAIYNLALGVTICKLFNKKESNAGAVFDYEDFWQHSLAVAVSAKIIAKKVKLSHQEELFVGGLLLNIGALVIDLYWPKFEKYGEEKNKFITENHALIGAALLKRWRLPLCFREMIINYKDPFKISNPESRQLALIVAVAEYLSNIAGYEIFKNNYLITYPEEFFSCLAIDEESCFNIIDDLGVEINRTKEFLLVENLNATDKASYTANINIFETSGKNSKDLIFFLKAKKINSCEISSLEKIKNLKHPLNGKIMVITEDFFAQSDISIKEFKELCENKSLELICVILRNKAESAFRDVDYIPVISLPEQWQELRKIFQNNNVDL